MSTLAVDAIVDSSNGNTTTINGATPTTYNTMGKNRIINGAMEIDQRNAGASVALNGNEVSVDRWKAQVSVSGKLTAQQSTSTSVAGFKNYLRMTTSSAYTPGATESFMMKQNIEGLNCSDLSWGTSDAKTVTLSFWVRSSLTGAFGGAVYNQAGNRVYPISYTINSANTWEQKSITITGDTTGTWNTDNSIGITLVFSLGSGSSMVGTANVWGSTYYTGSTGQTNLVSNASATLDITGVQLEAGSVATEFERRLYGTELQLCYRYFQKFLGSSTYEALPSYVIAGNNTTMAEGFFAYKCTMRAVPSFSISTLCLLDAVSVFALSGLTLNAGGVDSSRVIYTGMTGLTTYRSYYPTAYNSTSAYVKLDAEL